MQNGVIRDLNDIDADRQQDHTQVELELHWHAGQVANEIKDPLPQVYFLLFLFLHLLTFVSHFLLAPVFILLFDLLFFFQLRYAFLLLLFILYLLLLCCPDHLHI